MTQDELEKKYVELFNLFTETNEILKIYKETSQQQIEEIARLKKQSPIAPGSKEELDTLKNLVKDRETLVLTQWRQLLDKDALIKELNNQIISLQITRDDLRYYKQLQDKYGTNKFHHRFVENMMDFIREKGLWEEYELRDIEL